MGWGKSSVPTSDRMLPSRDVRMASSWTLLLCSVPDLISREWQHEWRSHGCTLTEILGRSLPAGRDSWPGGITLWIPSAPSVSQECPQIRNQLKQCPQHWGQAGHVLVLPPLPGGSVRWENPAASSLGPCLTPAVHQRLLWNVMCWSSSTGKSSAFCEARLLQRNLFCKILKGSVAICNSRIVGRWSGGSWDFNRQISCLCVFATPFYKGKHNLKYDYLVL